MPQFLDTAMSQIRYNHASNQAAVTQILCSHASNQATQPKFNPKQFGCGFDMKLDFAPPHPTEILLSALELYWAILTSAILNNHHRRS